MATQSQLRNMAKARQAKSQKSELRAVILEALSELGVAPQAAGRTVSAPAVERPVAKPASNSTNGTMTVTFVRNGKTRKGDKIAYEARTDEGYIGNLYLLIDKPALTVTIS